MSSRPLIDPTVLSHTELVSLVEQLLAENAVLKQLVSELRDENAQLKGLKGQPRLKPSGMEQATEPKRPAGQKPRRKGSKTARLTLHEDRIIPAGLPAGRPAGGLALQGLPDLCRPGSGQDLVLRPHVIRFRRERWVTPAGTTVVAPLPPEIDGHFGPQLKRFVLTQYHQGQVTIPRLLAQLHALGLQISKRQLVRLLTSGHETFQAEKDAILRMPSCALGWRRRAGSRSMIPAPIPAPATRTATVSPPRLATLTLPGSPPPRPRADGTSWSCCAPATRITS